MSGHSAEKDEVFAVEPGWVHADLISNRRMTSIEALIEKYNRLAANETARFCRAQDVAADLRSLRELIAAVVERMRTRQVDHRHEDEVGHWGVKGRAYFYAGDIYDDYEDLRTALGETRPTPPANPVGAS